MRSQQKLGVTQIVNGTFLVLLCVFPVWVWWPVYESPSYLLASLAAVVFGAAIGLVCTARQWAWWYAAVLLIIVFLVTGLPLTVPTALQGFPGSLVDGYLVMLRSAVTGWRGLLTLSLPVGNYQGQLVPFFLLCMVGSLFIWWFGRWGSKRYGIAGAVGLVMTIAGIAFGRSERRASVLNLAMNVDIVVGLVGLAIIMTWLLWRSAMIRRGTLALKSSVNTRIAPTAMLRKAGLSTVMVAVALFAAVTIPGVSPQQKVVLRTHIDTPVINSQATSPLPGLRSYFTDAQASTVILRATGLPDNTRIRLATMSYYDGTQFRATVPARSDAAFARVPYRLTSSGPSQHSTVTIEHLDSPWMPLPGRLVQINFRGNDALEQSRNFAYNVNSMTGVNTGSKTRTSDQYTVSYDPATTVDLAAIARPDTRVALFDGAVSETSAAALREDIEKWVTALGGSSKPLDGAKGSPEYVHDLISRLYWASSMSRSNVPVDRENSNPPKWIKAAGMRQDAVRASFAGENISRLDALFKSLSNSRHQCSSEKDTRCAVVFGDEEQLSAAAALVARYFKYDSRVVMGWTVKHGVAKSYDTTAWTEFGNAGQDLWYSEQNQILRTDNLPPQEQQNQDFKQFQYIPDTNNATVVPPPDARPNASGGSNAASDGASGSWAWIWQVLKGLGIALIILIILAAPFAAILFAKGQRRKSRRGASEPADRIAGGWDEYVDTAVDFGQPAPGNRTRQEVAGEYETTYGHMLAAAADKATFGPYVIPEGESEDYWSYVDYETTQWKTTASRWQTLMALFSLRSFLQRVSIRQSFDGLNKSIRQKLNTHRHAAQKRTYVDTATESASIRRK